MHETNLAAWEHGHSFGLDRRRPGERRTLIVCLLTAATMVVEIVAGIAFGSMALLADGLHMASHTVALGLALFAYIYCRRHAGDPRFAFGTGKVNSLGGYTSALLLAGFAVYMVVESVSRLVTPVPIVFDAAIAVAVIGLIVNGVSVLILDVRHREPEHDTDAHRHGPASHAHDYGHGHSHDGHGHVTVTAMGTGTAMAMAMGTVTVTAMGTDTATDTPTTTFAAPISMSSPMP